MRCGVIWIVEITRCGKCRKVIYIVESKHVMSSWYRMDGDEYGRRSICHLYD